jgi:hypothetical protein
MTGKTRNTCTHQEVNYKSHLSSMSTSMTIDYLYFIEGSTSSSTSTSTTTTRTQATTKTTILPEKKVLPKDDMMPAFIIGGLLMMWT